MRTILSNILYAIGDFFWDLAEKVDPDSVDLSPLAYNDLSLDLPGYAPSFVVFDEAAEALPESMQGFLDTLQAVEAVKPGIPYEVVELHRFEDDGGPCPVERD